jgi:class 3 adenylate cyclase
MLCRRGFADQNLDEALLESLDAALIVLDTVAFIGRYVRERVTLRHSPLHVPKRSKVTDDILNTISDVIAAQPPKNDGTDYGEVAGLRVLGAAIVEQRIDGTRTEIVGHGALCFLPLSMPVEEPDRQKMIQFHTRCTAPLIWQFLQQRVRVFLPVSPLVAERYWSAARWRLEGDELFPPWDRRCPTPRRTVTLGFDLRKSTFCMENADDPARFAAWLDEMVQILMRIAHRFKGVFDKFTGDGALVHFPVHDEVKNTKLHPNNVVFTEESEAVEEAVRCAIAMQKGIHNHLGRLRKFLRLDANVVGGAIGIDISAAHWTLDERDNPITVGRGVVNACRLMDDTKAGRVRLTNIAYQTMTDCDLKQVFTATGFASKEFTTEMGIIAWELHNAPHASLAMEHQSAVAHICESIWQRTK